MSASVGVALVAGTGADEVPVSARDGDAPLIAALEARGAKVASVHWDDADRGWAGYDVALVRRAWGDPARREAFLAWAEAAAEHTVVVNPADVLRWNSHKSYLLELEERGAPVVETAWLGAGDRVGLAELLAARGWRQVVIKPAVGTGAGGVRRVDLEAGRPTHGNGAADAGATDAGAADTGAADTGATDAGAADTGAADAGTDTAGFVPLEDGQHHLDAVLAGGDALVQPYLAAVETAGVLSVVVIDGEPSHAVRRLPATGEFRVPATRRSADVEVALDDEVAALAGWVVQSTGVELAYTRLDLLEDAAGTPQLLGLEVVDPDLFLSVVPRAAESLAEAVLAHATS